MSNEATRKQKFALMINTKLRFDKLESVDKQEASMLIGELKASDTKPKQVSKEAIDLIKKYFPDWDGNETLSAIPIDGKHTPAPPKEEPRKDPAIPTWDETPEAEEKSTEDKPKAPEDTNLPDPLKDASFKKSVEVLSDWLQESIAKATKEMISQTYNQGYSLGYKTGKSSAEPGIPMPNLPKAKTGTDYVPHCEFQKVHNLAAIKMDMLLTGPQGTGKSRMAKEIAASLGVDFYEHVFTAGMRTSAILWAAAYDPEKGSYYKLSALMEDMKKPGIILIDEVFAADPEVLLALNGLLEPGSRKLNSPCGMIERHEDNVIICTANTNGRSESRQYRGAQRADDSTLSRLVPVYIGYDENVERQLVKSMVGNRSEDVIAAFTALRQALHSSSLEFDASTRQMLQVSRMIQNGIEFKAAFSTLVRGHLSYSEYNAIKGSLTSFLD